MLILGVIAARVLNFGWEAGSPGSGFSAIRRRSPTLAKCWRFCYFAHQVSFSRFRSLWSSQSLVETLPKRLMDRFELFRAHTAEMAVASRWIVETIDVESNVRDG